MRDEAALDRIVGAKQAWFKTDGAPVLRIRKQPTGSHEAWLPLRITNPARTAIGAFRLVVEWNGRSDQRLACAYRGADAVAVAPKSSVAVWCHDLSRGGLRSPPTNPLLWRSDASSRVVAVAAEPRRSDLH